MCIKFCKRIKNFFRFKCTMVCCETHVDCENDTDGYVKESVIS